MLKLSNIHTHYGHIEALKGVSIEVEQQEIVTLIGANGAGKSTLLMTICSNPSPSKGRVTFKKKDITNTSTMSIVKMGLSQVPEGRRIFPKMTIFENLQLGATLSNPEYFDEDIQKVYEMFPILKKRHSQRAGTLSGGEQQMLAIGRALMSRPEMLLLDEPSLGLAPKIVKQIFEVIKEINAQGMTILLVEQNANHALKIADRGYVLVTGKIKMSGTGKELLENEEIQACYLEGGH